MNTRIVKNTHGTAAEALRKWTDGSLWGNPIALGPDKWHVYGMHRRSHRPVNVEFTAETIVVMRPRRQVGIEAELQRLAVEVPPQEWAALLDAQTKKVVVTVEGGMVSEVICPPGVEVEVRDYDVEGFDMCGDTGDLRVDDQGYRYLPGLWQYEPAGEGGEPK
jgi:hypothetical protein